MNLINSKAVSSQHFKRVFLLVLLACFSFVYVVAQRKFPVEWNVGVNAGATFSSLSFVPRINTKTMQGITGGVSARYISEENFGLIAELNYAQQGWVEDFSKLDPSVISQYKPAYTHRLSYLELPVMTHLYFGRKARFVFNFGPQLSFLTSQKESMNAGLSSLLAADADSSYINVRDQYGKKTDKSFDYGLVVGTGVELRTAVGNFMLEGRYYFGLGDIFNSSKSDYFSRSAHRVLSAKLTYYIKAF